MEDVTYAYWLANISGVGTKTIRQLYKYCGSAKTVWHLAGSELKKLYGITEEAAVRISRSKKQWDLDREWDNLLARGISFVSIEQQAYPRRLREIYDPPYGLYYIGQLPKDEAPAVSIVGGRACSPYGKDITAIYFGSINR